MEDNLFQENENQKFEAVPADVAAQQKTASKKKSKKKVKDDCCGLSELQLKEGFKAVLFASLLNQNNNISPVQAALALASKPCKDYFFTDFDSRPYTYSVNNKIKVYNNPGIEKYLIPAGAAYACSLAAKGEAVICELRFEEKNISFLSSLLHLNRTHDLPLTVVLHTHHELKAFAESFNADYFTLPGANIAADYDIFKNAVESSRNNKNISVIVTSMDAIEKYRGDNEKFLLSKKIITREELPALKEEAEEAVKNNTPGITLENEEGREKPLIEITNISYDPAKQYIDLPDFELLCFAAGIALAGFKINVSLGSGSFTYPFEKALSDFTAKNNLSAFPEVTVEAGGDEVKERIIIRKDVMLHSETPVDPVNPSTPAEDLPDEDIKEEPGESHLREDADSKLELEQEQDFGQNFEDDEELELEEESFTALLRDGEDMTLIIFDTEQSSLPENLADSIAENGLDAAVIKVTGSDYNTGIINRSLHHTGKALIIVSEGGKRTAASELICDISENSFPNLDAPVKRLILENGSDNIPVILDACEELNAF